jgi:hypothetical protein
MRARRESPPPISNMQRNPSDAPRCPAGPQPGQAGPQPNPPGRLSRRRALSRRGIACAIAYLAIASLAIGCLAILCLATAPALAAPQQNPLAAPDPFAGIFADETMTLTLERDGERYQGTIEFQGNQFAVTAERQDDRLSGRFVAEQNQFPFEAVRQGETLRFETGGTTYNLARRAAPAAAANSVLRQPAPPPRAAPQPGGPRYQSAAGFSLALPAGWQAQDDGNSNVGLLPPNQKENQEIYLVSPLNGVSDPADQRIAASLQDLFIHESSQPKATHELNTLNVDGVPVVVRDWRFPHPQSGVPLRLTAWLVADHGRVFAVLGSGLPQHVAARQAELQKLAGSLRYNGPTPAPQPAAPAPTPPPTSAAAPPPTSAAPLPTSVAPPVTVAPPPSAPAAQNIERHPQAPATPGRLSDGKPQSDQWLQHLKGKLLTQLESYSSGAAGGYSSNDRMQLYPDGRFEYHTSSLVSVNVDNANASSGGENVQRGTWRIVTVDGSTTYLAMVFDGANEERYARLDFQDNKTFLDGRRTFVTVPQ